MNTKIVLIGNIVSLIGSSFLFLSSTGKSKNGVLAFQTAGSGFLVVSGLLLRAYSGVAQDVISVIRRRKATITSLEAQPLSCTDKAE